MKKRIILVGDLDLDLTKRGISVGEIHNADIDGKIARFMDSRIDDHYPATVYPTNYIVIETHKDFNNAIQHFSKKMSSVENQLQQIKDKELQKKLSQKREELRTIIENLQVEHIKFT